MKALRFLILPFLLAVAAILCLASAPSIAMSREEASLLRVGQHGQPVERWPVCSGNWNCTKCSGFYSCENFINYPWCRFVSLEPSECNNENPFSCGDTYWWTEIGCGGTATVGGECFGNDC